jgi:uncharacterized membrane protein YkvA (DUF1232 family)
VHYSDDDTPRRARGRRDEAGDDLVGPRRGGAPRPAADAEDDDDLAEARATAPRDYAEEDEGDDADLVGPRRGARRRSVLDDDGDDAPRIPAPRLRRGGRERGERAERPGLSRETLKGILRDIPSFIKLFGRLATDGRVSKVDKAIVAAVLVYLVSPVDLIPDWVVPVVGQVEDVYLLALALSRLVNNAGVEVLMDHWDGDLSSLEAALGALDRVGSILPGPVQAILGKRR